MPLRNLHSMRSQCSVLFFSIISCKYAIHILCQFKAIFIRGFTRQCIELANGASFACMTTYFFFAGGGSSSNRSSSFATQYLRTKEANERRRRRTQNLCYVVCQRGRVALNHCTASSFSIRAQHSLFENAKVHSEEEFAAS